MSHGPEILSRMVELFAAVDNLSELTEAWIGSSYGEPRQDWWDSIDEVFVAFDVEQSRRSTIPGECQEMAKAVRELHQYIKNLDDGTEAFSVSRIQNLMGRLEDAREKDFPKLDFKPLETVGELFSQKVSLEQIAKMYGLPSTDLARQELLHPGSVVGNLYPHPDEQRHRFAEEFHRMYEEHMASISDGKPSKSRAKVASEEQKPCPETWEELFALRPVISFEQLCKMKCCTLQEVHRQARIHGSIDHLPIHERAAVESARRKQEGEKKAARMAEDKALIQQLTQNAGGATVEAEALEPHPPAPESVVSAEEELTDEESGELDAVDEGEPSLEESIISLSLEGFSNKEIADTLEVDGRKVAAVIRAYNKSQQEAEA